MSAYNEPKLKNMRLRKLSFLVLFFCKAILFSQTHVPNPVKSDFSGTLSFLASDWMEGREATSKGGFKAADYIASMMALYQLVPYNTDNSSFFQDFKILKHHVKSVSLGIDNGDKNSILFLSQTDFEVTPVDLSLKKEAEIVFAGYGLSVLKENYDDYKKTAVKGKIVLVLNGFPGYQDSVSVGYKKFKKWFPEENDLEETKIQNAKEKGAVAIIFLDTKGD
ncbi:MAG: hypothetical protein EOO19_16590 [Chryseobacterium sp.]|nr:MAG: hypothetical protein EOO19_16590 [Chryseobacterium sp.]